LWATEAIPLYVTSLLVPLLTVATGALLPASQDCATGDKACIMARFAPYPTHLAAKEICGQFFEPTVLLFLAGFSIGAALEKQRISHMIASVVLRPFGNRPENVLLGIMLLGMFLSMWISNIPSSVLCVSLSQAIVHQLPSGDPYAKALLLGIAFRSQFPHLGFLSGSLKPPTAATTSAA
jgi:phosphate transporter